MEKLYNDNIAYETLSQRIGIIRENIRTAALAGGQDPEAVKLMAVTKYVGASAALRAWQAGADFLGENREQSLRAKFSAFEQAGAPIHFIGRLQRNKAARVVEMVSMVQSLDSISLAQELDRQAEKAGKRLEVLVQVNIGNDPAKQGVLPEETDEFIDQVRELKHLHIRGLMTILPLGATMLESERYFSQIHALYVDIRSKNRDNVNMDCLSMGMSGDYKLAVKHGSTLVRLGTILFS